ncbi:MAG: hypothetical protein CMJ11_06290 [Pelagibacterales bacterium]|nr:hypothetical protein [Pelagibacterales bacterium]|tara:strand:+ start:5352 stop:6353 length:1002 start_codon:yes stop_codon:yes gene_type:complete
MSDINPWEDIEKNFQEFKDKLNKIRASSIMHPQNFFWAINFQKSYCFLYEGNKIENNKTLPKFEGFEISQQQLKDTTQLLIVLKDPGNRDIFRIICKDILKATDVITRDDSKATIGVIIKRLTRWQDIFRKSISKTLTKEQQIGLIGELLFLKDIMFNELSFKEGLQTWQGPLEGEQDFAFNSNLYEVKTQLSSSDHKIKISSLEQLNNESGKIYLIHQILSPNKEEDNNDKDIISLQEIINNIRNILSEDLNNLDLFESIIFEAGYVDNELYNRERYSLFKRKFFIIDDDFPKLVKKNIPTLVVSASYVLDINSLDKWEINKEDFYILEDKA